MKATNDLGRIVLIAIVLMTGASGVAHAADRHEGYYYPPVETEEEYKARARTMLSADRAQRIEFINANAAAQLEAPYSPKYAMFAKGEEAEKLIIVSLEDGILDTIYRMRGLLAQLTARARRTTFFKEYEVEDYFTFFDLLKLLGFTQLTVSDGKTFAHRITIE